MDEYQLIWGWQPALYLFLGGMGAGAFVAAAILMLRGRLQDRVVANRSMWAAFVCLCAGLLLLVSELITPLRGLLLWQSFSNPSSWMMVGAWVVFCAVIVFGLAALLTTPAVGRKWGKKGMAAKPAASSQEAAGAGEGQAAIAIEAKAEPLAFGGAVRVLSVVGLVLGVCVMAYTGILLMAVDGVPLWQTLLLPLLFTFSAFDTGLALVEIIGFASKGKHSLDHGSSILLERLVVITVVLEAVALAGFVAVMFGGNAGAAAGSASFSQTAIASITLLVEGSLAPWFWLLFVACGLALPLIASIVGLARKGAAGAVVAVGALGAIAGGCALRFLILLAGAHMDYVVDTLSSLPLWM